MYTSLIGVYAQPAGLPFSERQARTNIYPQTRTARNPGTEEQALSGCDHYDIAAIQEPAWSRQTEAPPCSSNRLGPHGSNLRGVVGGLGFTLDKHDGGVQTDWTQLPNDRCRTRFGGRSCSVRLDDRQHHCNAAFPKARQSHPSCSYCTSSQYWTAQADSDTLTILPSWPPAALPVRKGPSLVRCQHCDAGIDIGLSGDMPQQNENSRMLHQSAMPCL
ncbi:hypothetical protein K470DRAFT_22443 [Piedraia hortae CBS 480.64]|uniref:Uncharacterized protein n=1 Tax=Piedraia hortae CBS 480.64 TaxID=1314780 RepID=A0A6A7C3N6_9PEZI|nr:hypothetical protein K470DRAFT_22443 [Piedraia hortae CBS 480.64]